jgi:hypothetical protein
VAKIVSDLRAEVQHLKELIDYPHE